MKPTKWPAKDKKRGKKSENQNPDKGIPMFFSRTKLYIVNILLSTPLRAFQGFTTLAGGL